MSLVLRRHYSNLVYPVNSAMNCVNLKERFGDHYKVGYEECYYADHGDGARGEEPWLMIIPCKHGHLYPHGGDLLGVSTNTMGPITNKIRELACTTVVQDSDEGVSATFHVNDFDEVAAVVKPRRRRRQAPEQADRLAKYRFTDARRSA